MTESEKPLNYKPPLRKEDRIPKPSFVEKPAPPRSRKEEINKLRWRWS